MKREQLVWLLSATAGAAPLLEWGQGSLFDYPGMRFDSDGTFSITMFNDLHLGDNGSLKKSPSADIDTVNVINTVLDKERTNLVVLNGDLVSCEWLNWGDRNQANSLIDKIIQPLLDRGLYWATTFGNHDMHKLCDTRDMSEHMKAKGMLNGKQHSWAVNSVAGDRDEVGTSNYYIPVYSSKGQGNPELKMMLWFFDSKGGPLYQKGNTDNGVASNGWVDQKVVNWFHMTRDAVNSDHGRAIPSLVFVHIPPHVTLAFQSNVRKEDSTTAPGINKEIIGAQGEACEGCKSYNGADIPFMKALVETEGLMAVFSGHDHGIDWCMKWSASAPVLDNDPGTGNGINICFGRHTGYGGYSDWTRGGRQIVIREDNLGSNVVDTWIRLEDGTQSGQVTLNSTYGTDEYPAVTATKSSFAKLKHKTQHKPN